MNELLQLKGRFEQKSSSGRPGSPKLLANQIVSEKKILKLNYISVYDISYCF